MKTPMPMATVTKLTNGYLVCYHLPVERERVVPNPVPPGLFSAQAALAMALRSGDEDEDGDADADARVGVMAWEASRRQDREERVRVEIAKVERQMATQRVKQWVLEPQEYVAATLADVYLLLQQADGAQDKALELLRAGVAMHGMVPGTMIMPA